MASRTAGRARRSSFLSRQTGPSRRPRPTNKRAPKWAGGGGELAAPCALSGLNFGQLETIARQLFCAATSGRRLTIWAARRRRPLRMIASSARPPSFLKKAGRQAGGTERVRGPELLISWLAGRLVIAARRIFRRLLGLVASGASGSGGACEYFAPTLAGKTAGRPKSGKFGPVELAGRRAARPKLVGPARAVGARQAPGSWRLQTNNNQ